MTVSGRYDGHTVAMDLLELARSIQADKHRFIEEETRRRRLLARPETTLPSTRRPAVARPASATADPSASRVGQGSMAGGSLAR